MAGINRENRSFFKKKEKLMLERDNASAQNATLEFIKQRRSVRTFTEEPVSDSHIKALLQAANQAPSAHNQQSWRFIVIRGEKRKSLAKLVTAQATQIPRPASALLRMAALSIIGAPLVIAVVNTGELISRGASLIKGNPDMTYDFFRTMEIQSSAAAVENMLVAATSLGLSTVWLGILFLIKNDILDFLGEPKGEFMAVVPVGYAARPGLGPKKVPVEQVVKYLE
jgi:nitroreductase